MTDDNQFFKYVWRFNSVVIAIASLLFLFGALTLVSELFAFSQPTPINTESSNAEISKELNINYDQNLAGHDAVIFTLDTKGIYGKFSSGGTASVETNFGVFNFGDGSAKWAFSSNKQIIDSRIVLKSNIATQDKKNEDFATGFLISAVEKDTNGNGHLDESDYRNVYFLSVGLESKNLLLENVKKLHRSRALNNEIITIVFEDSDGLKASQFNKTTRKLSELILIKKP